MPANANIPLSIVTPDFNRGTNAIVNASAQAARNDIAKDAAALRQRELDLKEDELNFDKQIEADEFNTKRIVGTSLRLQSFINQETPDIDGAMKFLEAEITKNSDPNNALSSMTNIEDDVELLELLREGDLEPVKRFIDNTVEIGVRKEIITPPGGKAGSNKTFSKSSPFLIRQDDGSQVVATPILDQTTGETSVRLTPIGGTVLSRLGETPGEQSTRIIVQSGDAEAAKQGAQIDAIPERARVETTVDRRTRQINEGIEAAESKPAIQRTLALLKEVNTGGISKAINRVKQFTGLESGDEAELNNALSQAFLQQLKPVFGAQFTAAEGRLLEDIEANFGKSTAGNTRLIERTEQALENKIKRARRAATAAGDTESITEMDALLEEIVVPEETNEDDELVRGF